MRYRYHSASVPNCDTDRWGRYVPGCALLQAHEHDGYRFGHTGTYLLTQALLIFVAMLFAQVTLAQEAPRTMVRTHLEPAGTVMPGQPVKLVVDVMTTTWFSGAPTLPPLAVSGAIVTPASDQADNFNEEINGVRWFGISRNYLITPQTGGALTIPSFAIGVTPGGGKGPVTVHTQPMTLNVKVVARPPGAENAIGTSRLTITQRIDRKLDGLRTGDAFTRTIDMSVDGVQAMMLPPVDFAPIEGLSIYPKAPLVEDISRDRAGFVGGHRIDAATYLIQKAGSYTLPAVSIQWWDIHANQLRTATVPAISFAAVANPAYHPPIAIPQDASQPVTAPHRHIDLYQLLRWLALGAAVLVMLAWSLPRCVRLVRRWCQRRREHREAYRRSEAAAFARLQRTRRPQAFVAALYRWLDRTPAGPTATLAKAHHLAPSAAGDAGDSLLRALYAPSANARDATTIPRKVLRRLREALISPASARARNENSIPPLNPDS